MSSRWNIWTHFCFLDTFEAFAARLYFTVWIAEYVETFIRPDFLSITSPITLKLLSTLGPWKTVKAARESFDKAGYFSFNFHHQLSARTGLFSRRTSGKSKSTKTRRQSLSYISTSSSTKTFFMRHGNFKSDCRTIDFRDVIATGSMAAIFFKNSFSKGNFSAIYLAQTAYAFKALLKNSCTVGWSLLTFLSNLLAIVPTEIIVFGNWFFLSWKSTFLSLFTSLFCAITSGLTKSIKNSINTFNCSVCIL